MKEPSPLDSLATIPSTLIGLLPTQLGDAPPPSTPRPNAAPENFPETPALTSTSRYELLGHLGEGGVGRVERVRDRDLIREVAVKHLRPEYSTRAEILAQFLWEARVTAYLDHPNIVPVHDVGRTSDGQLFFTMKLARGEALEALLRRVGSGPDRVPLTRRLRWFLQLCNAVAYAHARGVLHRDLKPSNVLIGAFGEVLVTDWGLALPLPGDAAQTIRSSMPDGLASISAGTPAYMSPEQARAESLDARSDIYTLGAILYELVTLERALAAENAAEAIAKLLEHADAPLDRNMPGLSSSLAAIVRKAMAHEPAARYRTVEEMAADVETAMDGRTPRAEDASLARKAVRYYLGRDPAVSGLRMIDIDLVGFSSFLVGAGVGALFAPRWAAAAWIAVALGVLMFVVAVRQWLRLRRAASERARETRNDRP